MSSTTLTASSADDGCKYAKELIAIVKAEHLEMAPPHEMRSDRLRSMVHELTEPYQCASTAAHYSSTCSVAVGRVTVVLREGALQAFANVLWQFVSRQTDELDEGTLAAFRGDS